MHPFESETFKEHRANLGLSVQAIAEIIERYNGYEAEDQGIRYVVRRAPARRSDDIYEQGKYSHTTF